MKSKAGFTLIELMIVGTITTITLIILIISILVGVALFKGAKYVSDHGIKPTADVIYNGPTTNNPSPART